MRRGVSQSRTWLRRRSRPAEPTTWPRFALPITRSSLNSPAARTTATSSSALERSLGPQWGALNIGHLYQVLDRLKRDRLVEVLRAEPQPRRPDRLIYAITPAGREELSRWLQTPAAPAVGYRDDLYLKLVAAARAGRAQLIEVLQRERHAHLAELHTLRSLPTTQTPDALAAC
jgi:DNA-binding PadR family transcriptional regulator